VHGCPQTGWLILISAGTERVFYFAAAFDHSFIDSLRRKIKVKITEISANLEPESNKHSFPYFNILEAKNTNIFAHASALEAAFL